MKPRTLDSLPERYAKQVLEQLNPGFVLGHAASYPHHPAPLERLPHPEPEQDAQLLPLGQDKDEGGGPRRTLVSIERRGTKLLDVDNLYGSVKFICDALRYEHLIPEDNPEAIELVVTQKKVAKGETETVIQITYA